MNKLKEYIRKAEGKILILSLDLDNTLVNRDLGSNWVYPPTIELLKKIKDQNNIRLLVNTGRELIGYSSFCSQALDINNAILGSGSITVINGKAKFNSEGEIERDIINSFLTAVRQGIVPFVDFSHFQGRTLYFSKDVTEKGGLNGLFYSQNPRDWFGSELPTRRDIENETDFPEQIFRIEFPISNKQKIIYEKITSKSSEAIQCLAEMLGIDSSVKDKYLLKRKAFFNDNFKGNYTFGRLERNSEFVNKGIGLVRWLEQSKLPITDVSIIHIGDRDSGIIDDTLVKRHISDAFMIMVGDKNKADNPHVDLYLKGSVDQAVYDALELVCDALNI